MELLPLQLDGFHDVVDIETHTFGFHNQLLHFLHQKPLPIGCRSCRWFCHRGSDARTRFQPTFLDQVLNDAVRSIRVDLELGGKSPDRRECLPGGEFAANERFLSGVDDLIEYRLAGAN